MHRIGEDVAETLDVIPAIVRVLRTVRPKYAYRCCTGTDLAPVGWLLRTLRGSSSKPRTFPRGSCAETVVLWSIFVCTDALRARLLTASTQSAQEPPNRGKINARVLEIDGHAGEAVRGGGEVGTDKRSAALTG